MPVEPSAVLVMRSSTPVSQVPVAAKGGIETSVLERVIEYQPTAVAGRLSDELTVFGTPVRLPQRVPPGEGRPANFESGTKLGPCSADESGAESPDCAAARPAKHIARRHTASALPRRLTIHQPHFIRPSGPSESSEIDLGRLI